ncbi:MAG: hypothetical protein IJP99_05275 [Methanobrevibacter sp.]|nr:hypothetical protein [Methanobrevibacter sp.]
MIFTLEDDADEKIEILEELIIRIVEEEMRKEGMEIRSVENENNIGNFDNEYKYISKIIDLTFEDLEWL